MLFKSELDRLYCAHALQWLWCVRHDRPHLSETAIRLATMIAAIGRQRLSRTITDYIKSADVAGCTNSGKQLFQRHLEDLEDAGFIEILDSGDTIVMRCRADWGDDEWDNFEAGKHTRPAGVAHAARGGCVKAKLHQRLEWLKRVARDKEVSPNAARLATVVCLVYLNAKSGMAWPSLETLADDVGLSVRHVQRLVRRLERLGYLGITTSTGRGRANVYRICTPERVTPGSPLDELKGDKSGQERVTPRPPQHIDRTICEGVAPNGA